MDPIQPIIELRSMQQLVEAIDENDNWTGVTDAAVRRKRQNRLNKRASRRRQIGAVPTAAQSQPITVAISHNQELTSLPRRSLVSNKCQHPIQYAPVIPYPSNVQSHSSSPTLIFPLPLDHLITLVQYNVLRATMTNMSILSMAMPDECGATLSIPIVDPPKTLPPSLIPTTLQLSTPHSPWIDLVPWGKLRDNLITYSDRFDYDDICTDLVGGLFDGYNELELRGILVWKDPWSTDGWEVTQGFIDKWGYLLKGCEDLLRSSNQWRALRGEEKLVFEP